VIPGKKTRKSLGHFHTGGRIVTWRNPTSSSAACLRNLTASSIIFLCFSSCLLVATDTGSALLSVETASDCFENKSTLLLGLLLNKPVVDVFAVRLFATWKPPRLVKEEGFEMMRTLQMQTKLTMQMMHQMYMFEYFYLRTH
jgi:hypothetical protein